MAATRTLQQFGLLARVERERRLMAAAQMFHRVAARCVKASRDAAVEWGA